MRIAIIGQQKFGKAVLDAFIDRGDTVAGVFCAPEKPAAAPDPLRLAAEQRGLRLFQLALPQGPRGARMRLRELDVDLGIMAYVLQFAPQEFTAIPRHGMIQFHPSLLPRYRGPSSINWPIIRGDTRTGLTIFRPTDGLDEGPDRAAEGDADRSGRHAGQRVFRPAVSDGDCGPAGSRRSGAERPGDSIAQDESQASYEGWCRDAEARINWHNHVDMVYNLIRGCNPAPAAWTTLNGKKLLLLESRKHLARTFSQVKGAHRRGHGQYPIRACS